MTVTIPAPTIEIVDSFEKHTLPSGDVVYYRDSDHSYWSGIRYDRGQWKGSGRLTGVSTVVAPFDWRPDGLMKWAARLNGDGIAALCAEALSFDDASEMRSALSFLGSGDSIWEALDGARLLYSQARDDAATRGTNVHKHALHALATGRPVPDFDRLSTEEAGFARGVMAFWHECEPEPHFTEQVVAVPDHGVAGRLDLICTLRAGDFVGQRAMVDAKTSGYLPIKHHAQLAGYEAGAQDSGLGRTDVQLILQVDAEGGYDLIASEATREDFELAVRLYRRAGKMQSASNAARKARRARAAA